MSIALHYSFRTLDHKLLFDSENIQEHLVEQVYLKFCDLQQFPQWLLNLQNLTHINVASNGIEKIPENIQKLTNLNYFDASDNRLTSLACGLFKLSQLRYLDVAGNFIEKIPKDLGNLRNLELLNFDRNFIIEIPEEITLCTSLFQISFDDCSRLFSIPLTLLTIPTLVNASFRNCNLLTMPSMISPSVKCLRIDGNFLLNSVPFDILKCLDHGLSPSEFYLIEEKDIPQMITAQENFIRNSSEIKTITLPDERIVNVPQQLEQVYFKSSGAICSLKELCLRKALVTSHHQIPNELRNVLDSMTAKCSCQSKIFIEAFVSIFQIGQGIEVPVSKFFCSKNCSIAFYEENKDKYLFLI